MLVVYQVFAVGEQFKRNTTSIGEAQVNGLLASFALGLQLANSGNAIALSAQDLDACDYPAAGPWKTRFASSWRPLPIVIADSGAPGTPDSFAVSYSTTTTIVAPALVIATPVNGAPANTYVVQSPNGFHPINGTERKDLIVAIEKPFGATGQCAAARVEKVAPSGTAACTAAQGCVELSFTAAPLGGTPYSVFNMGAADDVQKIVYDVDVAKAVVRSTQLIDSTGALSNAAPNPIASNIVNMKLQYGIDTDGDGMFNQWVNATGAWDKDALMSSPTSIATLNQIKAVRIGVIVQSEQFDKNLAGFTGGDYVNGDYKWSMFDGTVTGTIAASVSPPGNWRFRVYETVIPLRNEIWNKRS
jgi:type IV pilus assembly protein PilW